MSDTVSTTELNSTPVYTAPKPCPSCGHCPACGRGGYQFYPTYPAYPWYVQPYTYPNPYITYTGVATATSIPVTGNGTSFTITST